MSFPEGESLIDSRREQLNKGFDVLTDPVEDLGKAEFVPVHRASDERVPVQGFDLDVKAVAPQEDNLKWEVIETAGQMKSVDMFLNFMIMDINRNALRKNQDLAVQSKIDQLTLLWGDQTWKDAAFSSEGRLFEHDLQKVSNAKFEAAFRERLKKKAGFKYVSPPMPMKTKTNSVIYYLYFASQKPVATGIVDQIFQTYRKRQEL